MYYTNEFIDELTASPELVIPEDRYAEIQGKNIKKMLDADKTNYKLFGIYWWAVKDCLRKYIHSNEWYCGIADDLLMKERADHGSEYRNLIAAMYYMNESLYKTSAHIWHDKEQWNEHDYTLFDDNAGV